MMRFSLTVGPKVIFAFYIVLIIFMTGCESRDQMDRLDETVGDVKQRLGDFAKKFQNKAPSTEEIQSMTQEELEKLSAFEYKVEDFNKSMSASDVESALQTLGRDRWECFQVIQVEDNIRVFCKRPPKTYLRYIPRVF